MSEETADLRAQIRALSAERNDWKARAQEASGKVQALTSTIEELTPYRDQVASLQGELKESRARHSQDIHLTGLGISSDRGRRAIRREWKDTLAELGEGVEAPEFATFVEDLKADPFYGRWFEAPAAKTPEKPPVKPKTKPASNPNGGAATPKAPETPLDIGSYRTRRGKVGRKAARAQLAESLRKQGLIQ